VAVDQWLTEVVYLSSGCGSDADWGSIQWLLISG